ncbi:A24 family peptidase [Allorhizobium undicola]|uniref:A24 family peptidase n=1 Tax=Allorhizobium undicola TaxID=78527 RepID=UPI0004874C39|nr:prepilin peptidase [Allorhizobium undicola]
MSLALFAIFPLCLVVAAFTDLAGMKIPNTIPAIVLAGFFAAALYQGLGLSQIGLALAAGLAVLAGCFLLFILNAMGGGDAKLLAAAAPWFGFGAGLFAFLINVALCGGVLTLLLLVLRSQKARIAASGLRLPHSLLHENKVPYGIAIAAAGLLSLRHISVIDALPV